MQKTILLHFNFNPGLTLTGLRTTLARFQTSQKNNIKDRITRTLNSYYHNNNNNNNKYQQGSMNISEDITIKININYIYAKSVNLRYLDLI